MANFISFRYLEGDKLFEMDCQTNNSVPMIGDYIELITFKRVVNSSDRSCGSWRAIGEADKKRLYGMEFRVKARNWHSSNAMPICVALERIEKMREFMYSM